MSIYGFPYYGYHFYRVGFKAKLFSPGCFTEAFKSPRPGFCGLMALSLVLDSCVGLFRSVPPSPPSPALFNIVVLQELRGKINGHKGRVAVVRRRRTE